ncbi:MAG: hypothetical protein LBQ51_02535 [Desulfovibrio sp.]|nr:hypothetical protein [Desulfovibrio sp.]
MKRPLRRSTAKRDFACGEGDGAVSAGFIRKDRLTAAAHAYVTWAL